jgi:two-component system sensor histidine kinase KdpD
MAQAATIIASAFDMDVRFEKQNAAQESSVVVPVILNGAVFAVMVLTPHDVQRQLSPADLILLQTCAEVISNNINLIHNRDQAYRAQASHDHEKFRNVLLSSLSHDLRTPLTLMNASLSTILKQRKALPRAVFDEITVLWTRLNGLQTFVGNLLRMASLTSGQMTLNIVAVSLPEILGAVYEQFNTQKGARLMATKIEGQIPLVKADGALIEQVLVNLIGNAIKHTKDDGHITITIDHRPDTVRVRVQDDGDGIPKGQESAIFERFLSLGDKGSDRQQNATGLGLAICQHIILAHNGTIYAQNTPKGGASFIFTLPVWTQP